MFNILHLDDSKEATAQTSKDLSDIAETFPANNVQDALKLIKSHTFDAFLVEYNLGGGITGFDLATKIRKLPQYKRTPILLTSAEFDKTITKKAKNYKINQCILKTTPPDELKEIVASQIKKPTIVETALDEANVKTLQWEKEGKFYLFSPDIEELVVAESAEDCAKILGLITQNSDEYRELSQKSSLKDLNLTNVTIDFSKD
ncbi:MAG: response regulator [Fibrobacterales bacterium]